MTPADATQLARIADTITHLGRQLHDIGDEVRRLQAATFTETAAPAFPPAPPILPPYAAPPGWTPFPPGPTLAQTPPFPFAPPLPPWGEQPPMFARREAPGLWERLGREGAGSRLLAWVGGAVTLAGVVMLLVLAVQRGYIGPSARVLAGAGLGVVLVAIGLALHRRDNGRAGAYAVAATGFACLFLDVVAATSVYDYLSAAGGLGAALAVTAAGTGIAYRWRSEAAAVFVVVACAISSPILTDGVGPLLIGFLLMLFVATTPVHVVRRWPGLALAGGIPPMLALAAQVSVNVHDGSGSRTTLTLAAIAGAVYLVAAVAAARRDENGAGSVIAIGLAAAAPVPTLLAATLVHPDLGAAVVGGLAAALAMVWALHMTRVLPVGDAVALTIGGGATVAGVEALCLALNGSARTGSILAAATVLALLGLRLRYRGAVIAAAAVGTVGALDMLATSLPPEFFAHAPRLAPASSTLVAVVTTGLLVVLAALAIAVAADRVLRDAGTEDVRLPWAVALVVALYGASGVVLAAGLAVSPDADGFRSGHVAVTVSWTVGAIVLLLRRIDSTSCRVAGLSLVGAAVAKLVLFDLASLSGIPRVLAFLVAGLALLAAGARYAAMVAQRASRPEADTATRADTVGV